MNRFKKINDQWAVDVEAWATTLPGCTVSVMLASGATKQVQLGAYLGNGCFATAPRAAAATVAVGSLDGIIALFDKAAARLKFPAVVLAVRGSTGLDGIRVSRAGSRSKAPGSLNVTSAQRDESEYGRTWYGRVTLDGQFQPSRDCVPAIAEAIKAFAANPAKVASEYGKVKRLQVQQEDGSYKMVGQCCFCMKALTDERSTAVGYGKICAGHYGLPWGCTEAKPLVAAFDGQPCGDLREPASVQ